MKTAIIVLLFVFNNANARTIFYPEGGPNGGWRQVVSGVPDWVRPMIRYDEVGVWEIEAGPPDNWMWEPVYPGNVITKDDHGIVKVTR